MKKKLLIIGGTRFVGRNLLEKLVQSDTYDCTLFNRGITNPDLFPDIKRIKGDRTKEEDLRKISSKDWDCVIDISGYWAGALETQLALQKGKVGRYIYVSTCSHYQFDPTNPHLIKEEEALIPCTEAQKVSAERTHYNQNKAECERILARQQDLNYIILRPGLIIGKYDYTDRLYYWFYKVKQQQEVLIAKEGTNVLSFTDVQDLSALLFQSITVNNTFKVYNAASYIASISDFIQAAKASLNKEVRFISAPPELLAKEAVKQWTGLPLWLDGDFLTVDSSRIIADYDFKFRKLEDTIQQLLPFYASVKKWKEPVLATSSISIEKEQQLIADIKKSA